MKGAAWLMVLTSLAMSAAAVVLLVVMWGHLAAGQPDPSNIELALGSVIASFVGALIVSRRPGNNVGWLLALVGIFGSLSAWSNSYEAWGYLLGHDRTFGGWAVWVSEWSWAPQFLLLPGLLPLIFPDGKLLSRRWVPAVISCCALIVVAFLITSMAGHYAVGGTLLPNPFPIRLGFTIGDSTEPAVVQFALAAFGAQFAVAATSLVYRWRGADSIVRAQLKWFLYATGVLAVVLIVGLVPAIFSWQAPSNAAEVIANDLLNQAQALAFGFVLIAIGIAVFRYRLYDIDLIINRTLVYGGMTAILAGLYAAFVTLGQRLFIAVTGQKSDAAVVLTAFALGTLFTPLKDALQKLVSRHVGASNPNTSLESLSDTIDSVIAVLEGETIARRVLQAAVNGYGAQFGVLDFDDHARERIACREWTAADRVAIEVPIRFDGRLLGRLVLGERRGTGYSSRDRETLRRSAEAIARALVFADSPRPVGNGALSRDGSTLRA